MFEEILRIGRRIIPERIFRAAQPLYHFTLALCAAVLYGFPSRNIKVVAVTGTKGKSTVVELTTAILEEAGFAVASLSTIRFKIGKNERRNLYKMTTPGRFFVQKFLRNAIRSGCAYAVLEMTSEAARNYRHAFIGFDAVIFTNLAREHIESHGSYEKYRDAKLSLVRALERSPKHPRTVVANADDVEGWRFLDVKVEEQIPYRLNKEEMPFETKLVGAFNQENILAAVSFAKSQGVSEETARSAVAKVSLIPGRVEFIQEGQKFDAVVDYAHTPDSLEKLYRAFAGKKIIAVLGNTGGGRDVWKRPEMGRIADTHAEKVFLTNEDPYDEDPRAIVEAMARGMARAPEIIMDRRAAIRAALQFAQTLAHASNQNNTVVLITGKGADPYIMGANGAKEPWDDREVTREELKKILHKI
ncbi:MAG: hypothetical protein A3C08_02470 [Candidatus Taylorbacteria bacterium RIFCSPHIGHO2_02_FULL_47_18]|uniref:UDP-N-acetylmuramoyl-L-alanyl-D-glutamate--2, 6-diaminopimelate ligase n=1 Tax=Candidatus Taylorbacteria bacterium RIFCSPLOWO2_01_FULL_48_100 TaxID=1802322 RepID=A0A1G2ND10_9BACT|nr:MAG: hypothetical protein A3C08_02470 [Candidatus Taylorbacteria bacterium RIFCSPHIGHO2_02_FULL_47_18]OHA34005.1 MAG: hypothetical protein A2938_02450 [Candidatus Taylorbacteria bacterium RIFCSPLOWO2_01_FULL_48_100]